MQCDDVGQTHPFVQSSTHLCGTVGMGMENIDAGSSAYVTHPLAIYLDQADAGFTCVRENLFSSYYGKS